MTRNDRANDRELKAGEGQPGSAVASSDGRPIVPSQDGSHGAGSSAPLSENPLVAFLLGEAQEAVEEEDTKAFKESIDEALSLEPDNLHACLLQAKYGFWHFKQYDFDGSAVIRAAQQVLDLAPAQDRFSMAADIYVARKHQIAKMLEAAMMMPSYTAAKQLHEIMGEWKRLLSDIPYLTPGLIAGEVELCRNLCLRSKMGIMPGDRLVYTAYATLNGKESYGDQFARELQPRIDAMEARKASVMEEVEGQLQRGQGFLARLEQEGLPAEEERQKLEDELRSLQAALSEVVGLSDRGMFLQQLEELQRQRASLKLAKVFKRRELDEQIAAVEKKLRDIDAQMVAVTEPLEEGISAIESRLLQLP